MPRGRPKKKAIEPEVLPPEENDQPLQQVREVKHKTEWVELRSVEDTDIDPEEIETEDKPKRKAKNEREELQKLLAQNNITPASQLRLFVERYVHSESAVGGVWAEKEFLTRYTCTKEHITSEDYLDVARKWGPGTYWFTLRMIETGKKSSTRIVASWERRLGGAPMAPVIQNVNPADPNSPQFIVQMPEGMSGQQPVAVVDPIKQMRETAKMYRELRETFEPEAQQLAQPEADPETLLLKNLAGNPKFMDKVNSGVIRKIFGEGAVDDDPSWQSVVMKSIETGQMAASIDSLGRVASMLLNQILPQGWGNNGTPQMAPQTVQNQAPQGANQQQRSEFVPNAQAALQQGASPMGSAQTLEQGTSGNVGDDVLGGVQPQMATTPEEYALQMVIDHCRRQAPVGVAFDRLVAYADTLNAQAPHLSIDEYISIFAGMPIEAAIEFVKTQPNGETVASLPHAKEWCAELQRLIREEGQGGEDR